MKVILAIFAAGAALFTTIVPALAGGWAVTILDPLPDRIEAGHAYTAGYWVLQHGSHPAQFAIGETGLKLVDERGQSLTFPGVALAEPAHYATAFALPHDGAWELYGVQGVFQEYKVGMISVPGALTVLPTPAPLENAGHDDHVWGAIHPPKVVTEPHTDSVAADHSAMTRSARLHATGDAPAQQAVFWMAVVAAVLLTATGAVAIGNRISGGALFSRFRSGHQ